jgi:hypothetical protein
MRYFFMVCVSVLLTACAHAPESVSEKQLRIADLTHALQKLSPQVQPLEARQLAEVAVNTAAQLRDQYQVNLTPWLHNVEVYWGAKERGYCYQYAKDLYAALIKVPAPDLQLHFIRAHDGEMLEHNALSVTLKGQPWDSGFVLDAWREAGVLVFVPVKEDKYPWKLVGPPSDRGSLKNVTNAAKTRQNFVKNRSLQIVNEDFEQNFNAVFASAVVVQRLPK